MNARENANIWRSLFGTYPNGEWMGWRLFTKDFWKSPYLWKDSFGQYWYKWIVCPIRGHQNVKDVSEPNEPSYHHCFDCQEYL